MNDLHEEARIALHGVWRQRWLALAVAWGVCLAGWLVLAFIPNRYESRARLFVQQQSMIQERLGVTPVERQRQIDNIRQTMISGINLEKVVRGTELARTVSNPADMAARVATLQEDIKVVAQQDNLFEVTASSAMAGASDAENARYAQAIVAELIDVFVTESIAGGRLETSQSLQFLDAQLAQRQQRLQDAEQRRMEFENRYMGVLPGVGSVSDRMAAARGELGQIDSQLTAAQSSLAAVNGQMAGTSASIAAPGTGTAGPAGARLATLEGQLADARARGWTDGHPDVIAIRNQMANARAAAAGEGRNGVSYGSPNPLYISLRSMQAEKQATVAALASRKAQLEGDMNRLMARQSADPGATAEQGKLDRDYQVLRTQYEKLLADREQIALRGQVDAETDAVVFRVIDAPTVPTAPAAPNRPLLLGLVLVLGIGAGIAAAFARGQLRGTYPTADRLARASGLPVIGAVGEVLSPGLRDERRRKLALFGGGSAALAAASGVMLAIEFVQRGGVA